jgi:hypothetical protein
MHKPILIVFSALVLLAGCNNSASKPASVQAQTFDYGSPPTFNTGITVEQAYEAVPHRRTVFDDSDTTVPVEDRAYLKTVFQTLDQATAVRVAGMQNLASGHVDYSDPDAEYDQLVAFLRGMSPPQKLEAYHHDILDALINQRQFFADWKSKGERFSYPQAVRTHPSVQRASSALRSAYNELMAHYPHEAKTNQDAFFDYHCALDFL